MFDIFNIQVFFFRCLTVHLDIIKVFFIYKLMHKRIALKKILKFTLKQLRHISVQSPSSGIVLFELTKVTDCTELITQMYFY